MSNRYDISCRIERCLNGARCLPYFPLILLRNCVMPHAISCEFDIISIWYYISSTGNRVSDLDKPAANEQMMRKRQEFWVPREILRSTSQPYLFNSRVRRYIKGRSPVVRFNARVCATLQALLDSLHVPSKGRAVQRCATITPNTVWICPLWHQPFYHLVNRNIWSGYLWLNLLVF